MCFASSDSLSSCFVVFFLLLSSCIIYARAQNNLQKCRSTITNLWNITTTYSLTWQVISLMTFFMTQIKDHEKKKPSFPRCLHAVYVNRFKCNLILVIKLRAMHIELFVNWRKEGITIHYAEYDMRPGTNDTYRTAEHNWPFFVSKRITNLLY